LIASARSLMAADEMPKKLRFAPVIDGVNIRSQDKTLRERARIPLIIGSNKDEATFFKTGMPPITTNYYQKVIKSYFGHKAASVLAAFPVGTDEEAEKQFMNLHTCNLFTIPISAMAGKLSGLGGNVYVYRFNRSAPRNQASGIGASHGEEIPYIFGHTHEPGYAEEDNKVSVAMMKYWVQFGRTGNPNAAGWPVWPEYTPESDKYLSFGDEVAVKDYADDESLKALSLLLA